MERVREFHRIKQEQIRGAIRTRLLERAFDALDRMDAEHIDFKGKDLTEVTYPTATASDILAWTLSSFSKPRYDDATSS